MAALITDILQTMDMETLAAVAEADRGTATAIQAAAAQELMAKAMQAVAVVDSIIPAEVVALVALVVAVVAKQTAAREF